MRAEPEMFTVVAALIQRDGRILICQRRRNDAFPLKWEFPGGKVKPGENPQQALARELQEELSVAVTVGPELYRTEHQYEEHAQQLQLLFFAARLESPDLMNLAFEQIQWAELARLGEYDFLAADRELIELLARGVLQLPA